MGRKRRTSEQIGIPLDIHNRRVLKGYYGEEFISKIEDKVDFDIEYYGNIPMWWHGIIPKKDHDILEFAVNHRNEILEDYINSDIGRKLIAEKYFSSFGLNYNNVGSIMVFIGLMSDEVKLLKEEKRVERLRAPQHKNIFEELNDTSAYILGFIVGDGCITGHGLKDGDNPRAKEDGLVIACNDYQIIHDIAEAFEVDSSLDSKYIGKNDYKGRYNTTYYFNTDDYDTIQTLYKLGVRKRKSNNGCHIDLPKNLYAPFVRGLLDSDGYVRQKELAHSIGANISICGHESYLMDVVNNTDFDWKYGYSKHKGDSLFFIEMYRQSEVKRFYEWLYRGATIKLERKYNATYYPFERGEFYGKYREYSHD